jgi:protein TonB
MESRKTAKGDLESKKAIFFEIGLVIAMALVYISLNAKSYEKRSAATFKQQVQHNTEELVPITEQKQKLPPPPPPPKQVTQIKIVSNDVKVNDNVDIDVSANMNTAVAKYTPPVEDEDVQQQQIFVVVEDMPQFPGGMGAVMKFLATHIQYPALAKESGIQGRVFINFVVEPNGQIDHVKVLRGIGGGCDEEAVRVVKSMPKWIPGKQRGKPVRVSFNLPVKFTLE